MPDWSVSGTKVSSKATSSAKPRVVPPNPKQEARDALLTTLQVHADGMARLLGNVVKPRLLRHPSRVCWGGVGGWAHAHVTNRTMYRVEKGKRSIRLGNLYGTICLSDRFLDMVIGAPERVAEVNRRTGNAVLPADGLDTVAHEVAHLRYPKRRHNSFAFEEMAERLEREYREVLAGTRSLPPPRAFPGKPVPMEDSFLATWERVIKAGHPSSPRIDAGRQAAEPRQSEPQGVGEAEGAPALVSKLPPADLSHSLSTRSEPGPGNNSRTPLTSAPESQASGNPDPPAEKRVGSLSAPSTVQTALVRATVFGVISEHLPMGASGSANDEADTTSHEET
jgi:hypothetical protein